MHSLLAICLALAIVNQAFSSTANISPDLYKNKLKFPWGINYKYNGQLHHNLDRVWVVTKIPIPKFGDIKFYPESQFTLNCSFSDKDITRVTNEGQRLARVENKIMLKALCEASKPGMRLYRDKQERLKTILTKLLLDDLHHALPQLVQSPAGRRKRFIAAILGPVLSGLATLAVEQLNTHLQNKRMKAMEKAMVALRKRDMHIQNYVKQFKDDFIMYGTYNAQNLEEIVQALNSLSSRKSDTMNLLQGNDENWPKTLLSNTHGVALYGNHLQLFFQQLENGQITVYQELINSAKALLKSIAQLSKGYLPPEIFTMTRMRNITDTVLNMVQKTHPEYVLALPQLTQYYDMKLVTFAVDEESHSLIVTFPVFIKTYHRNPLTLYEIETVPVPINDLNPQANSYTEVQITKPYIAINNDYYIQLRIQELRMCKRIQYSYYCEELFLVKHKTKHSCESALYFNLAEEVIQENCEFKYYFNKTVTPSVLDGGNQIVLANILNQKKLICRENYNLAQPLPSHEYVRVNRSILCNCEIESGMTYVLRSIGACNPNEKPQPMEFTINLAFYNHFKKELPSMTFPKPPTSSLREYKFPIALQEPKEVEAQIRLNPPTNLRELMAKMKLKDNLTSFMLEPIDPIYEHKQEHHLSRGNFLFMFSSAVATCTLLGAVAYLALQHYKLRTLVAGIILQHLPLAQAAENTQTVTCQEPWLSYFLAALTILGALIYLYQNFKHIAICKGYKFEKSSCLYLSISNTLYYVPIKLKPTPGHMHLFSVNKLINIEQISIKEGFIWDTMHIDWEDVKITHRNKRFPVPTDLTIPILNKFMMRSMLQGKHTQATLMIKMGHNWSYLLPNKSNKQPEIQNPTTVQIDQ